MVMYLGFGPNNAMEQSESTRGAHEKFSYLSMLYKENLELAATTYLSLGVCLEVLPPILSWHIHFFG